jgi:hypothetical protein
MIRLNDAFRAGSADVDRGVPQSRPRPLSRGGRAQEQNLPNVGWFVAYGSLCQAEDQNRLSKPTRTCSIAATAVDARHGR